MNITAKKIDNEGIVGVESYEFFDIKIIKDTDGNDREIPYSIGIATKADIENQNWYFANELEKTNQKLAAINSL